MKRLKILDSPHLKLLFYGAPGSTKTRTAATAALDDRTAPVLHLDIGGNTLSVADYRPPPDIIRIDEMQDLNAIYDFLKTGQKSGHPLRAAMDLGDTVYKTVIVDGVTDLHRRSLAIVSGNQNKMPGDIPISMQIQHYMPSLAQMTNLASLFYKLPMHVIITALERRDQDSMGNIMYSPLLAGQASQEVAGYAYAVARLVHIERLDPMARKDALKTAASGGEKPQAMAFFQPTVTVTAKDQHGFGVTQLPDPTIPKLLDLLEKRRAAALG